MRIAGFFISAEPAPNKGENNQRNSQNAKQGHGFCSHCWGRIERDIVIRGDNSMILRFRTIMRKDAASPGIRSRKAVVAPIVASATEMSP
jgi:hypothetical protein